MNFPSARHDQYFSLIYFNSNSKLLVRQIKYFLSLKRAVHDLDLLRHSGSQVNIIVKSCTALQTNVILVIINLIIILLSHM